MAAAGNGARPPGLLFSVVLKYLDILKLLFGHLQLSSCCVDKLHNYRQQ